MSHTEDPGQQQLISDIDRYGDRSSSWSMLSSRFESADLRGEGMAGQVRYQCRGSVWAMANEPLSSRDDRASAFGHFERFARTAGKEAAGFPITAELAQTLHRAGTRTLFVGVEAIFDLDRFVPSLEAIYADVPLARNWLRKRAQVIELPMPLSEEHRARIEGLAGEWLSSRRGARLGFLSRSAPTELTPRHRVFAVNFHQKWQCVLTLSCIEGGKTAYIQDMLRPPGARAGTMEYLILESLRILHASGVERVAWGLSPLQGERPEHHLHPLSSRVYGILNTLKPLGNRIYPFDSLYEFKLKLRPSRLEPRYLAVSKGFGLKHLPDLYRILVPGTAPGTRLRGWLSRMLRPDVMERLPEIRLRYSRTLVLAAICVALHLGRTVFAGSFPGVQAFYLSYPFQISGFTWTGLLASPFFHNTTFHLCGDLLTLVLGGILLESLGSWMVYWGSIAIGLWLSNPVTWAVGWALGRLVDPELFERMSRETDYGSSNAVYAMVGALAAITRSPKAILIPFAFNAAIVCAGKHSVLAIHHAIALALGFALPYAAGLLKKKPNSP